MSALPLQNKLESQPNFLENFRQASQISNNNPSNWDQDKINSVLDERYAGNDVSENPMMSLNVEIPKTFTVRRIQNGELKLDNDTNITGINNDNALYIVGNTYQYNDDGSYYGMGWDGRPYSYTIKNNTVGDFTPLDTDEQKRSIERLTDGRITVHDTITNPGTLAEIYRSIKRMYDYGNGNLIPDNVLIGDSDPESVEMLGGNGIMGIARFNYGTPEEPDHIDLLGSNFPDIQKWKSDRGAAHGWFSAGGGDDLPQHELAHTAEYAISDAPDRYSRRVAKEAEKYAGKYSTGDILSDGLSKIKYFIPSLIDSIFGTHIIPTEEEWYEMPDGIQSAFWEDAFMSLEDKYDTVEEKMNKAAYEKNNEWFQKYGYTPLDELLEEAAKNTGFDSAREAMASISEYAKSGEGEAFAEAYADVLLNGNKAKPFSKELIRLYSDLADKAEKDFGRNKKPVKLETFNQLMEILPKGSAGTAQE